MFCHGPPSFAIIDFWGTLACFSNSLFSSDGLHNMSHFLYFPVYLLLFFHWLCTTLKMTLLNNAGITIFGIFYHYHHV